MFLCEFLSRCPIQIQKTQFTPIQFVVMPRVILNARTPTSDDFGNYNRSPWMHINWFRCNFLPPPVQLNSAQLSINRRPRQHIFDASSPRQPGVWKPAVDIIFALMRQRGATRDTSAHASGTIAPARICIRLVVFSICVVCCVCVCFFII